MHRRAFLTLLASAAFDPERALWTPGRKLISIPSAPVPCNFTLHEYEYALELVSGPFLRLGDRLAFHYTGLVRLARAPGSSSGFLFNLSPPRPC